MHIKRTKCGVTFPDHGILSIGILSHQIRRTRRPTSPIPAVGLRHCLLATSCVILCTPLSIEAHQ